MLHLAAWVEHTHPKLPIRPRDNGNKKCNGGRRQTVGYLPRWVITCDIHLFSVVKIASWDYRTLRDLTGVSSISQSSNQSNFVQQCAGIIVGLSITFRTKTMVVANRNSHRPSNKPVVSWCCGHQWRNTKDWKDTEQYPHHNTKANKQ